MAMLSILIDEITYCMARTLFMMLLHFPTCPSKSGSHLMEVLTFAGFLDALAIGLILKEHLQVVDLTREVLLHELAVTKCPECRMTLSEQDIDTY